MSVGMETNTSAKTASETGQSVRLLPEYAEGDNSSYVIVEMRGDRCVIQPTEWQHGPIVPQECVSCYMLGLA